MENSHEKKLNYHEQSTKVDCYVLLSEAISLKDLCASEIDQQKAYHLARSSCSLFRNAVHKMQTYPKVEHELQHHIFFVEMQNFSKRWSF